MERKIAEEHGQALGEPVAVGAGGAMHKPVDALFPALVGLLGAPELEIKAQAFAGIHEMMERLGVRYEVSRRDTLASGETIYHISHSDKLFLLDAEGRIVETYGGSAAVPEMVVEDARALL